MSEFDTGVDNQYAFDFSQYPATHAEGQFNVGSHVRISPEAGYVGLEGTVTRIFVSEKHGLVYQVADDTGDLRHFVENDLILLMPDAGQSTDSPQG